MADDSITAAAGNFDELPIPAGVIDPSGTIIAVNRAGTKLLARPAADLVGRPAWAFAPGIEHVWAELVALARARGEHTGELTIATPIGARAIRYMMAARTSGERAFILALAVDVTRDEAS